MKVKHNFKKKFILLACLAGLLIILGVVVLISRTKSATLLPNDVKSYPGSALRNSEFDLSIYDLARITFTSKDPITKISNWFVDEYQKDGWEIDTPRESVNTESNNVQYVRFTHGDRFVGISLIRENDTTKIIVEKFFKSAQMKYDEYPLHK